MHNTSLQSRHNFSEQVLSIFLTKIMAIIFDFNGIISLRGDKTFVVDSGSRYSVRAPAGSLCSVLRQNVITMTYPSLSLFQLYKGRITQSN